MTMKVWLLRGLVAAVLALVFVAYLRPSLLLDLGNQIALCF
jgi:hypothetical protein